MTNLRPPPVYKVIVAQLAATIFIAAVSLLFSGSVIAYSVLLGGLISALPNSYFAFQAFKYQGARNADKVVKSFIKQNNLESGIDAAKIDKIWEKLMGKNIKSYTNSLELSNRKLYVKLNSSVLREELNYGKEEIVKMLNEELKKECIEEIILC